MLFLSQGIQPLDGNHIHMVVIGMLAVHTSIDMLNSLLIIALRNESLRKKSDESVYRKNKGRPHACHLSHEIV